MVGGACAGCGRSLCGYAERVMRKVVSQRPQLMLVVEGTHRSVMEEGGGEGGEGGCRCSGSSAGQSVMMMMTGTLYLYMSACAFVFVSVILS